ncbi:MAG: OmpA family protein [Verrucomicrobiales bacterium]|nr:OmpA family protein [Verrucomicrobiales bacterium]
MKLLNCRLLSALSLAITLPAGVSLAQDSTEELIERLRGQSGNTESTGGDFSGFQTRGLSTRSISAPATTSETRSLYFSTRGLPKSIQVAAEEDTVALSKTTAKASTGAGDYSVAAGEEAIEVKYSVDPESKVTKDNILFKKGSAEFADEGSFQVVAQLARALKDPSLAKLKYVIEGHASAEGSAYANQELSQRRAERIVSVLGSLGVNASRLLPLGFGETQARFPAHSEEYMLKQDRRVLIFRLD